MCNIGFFAGWYAFLLFATVFFPGWKDFWTEKLADQDSGTIDERYYLLQI